MLRGGSGGFAGGQVSGILLGGDRRAGGFQIGSRRRGIDAGDERVFEGLLGLLESLDG